jgi:hypothetical protein
MAGEQTRVLPFWHSMMNKGLTLVSNMFCNLNLTDMETCYKVFRTDLLKSIPIRSDRFGFEPEIVMKSAKRKLRIYEVPISYHGRTYEEGKKIGWKDGLRALAVIFKFWLIDDLYAAPYGRGVLNNLTGTPQYLSWLARKLRPHIGDEVLEVGAGIGNIAGRLMARRRCSTWPRRKIRFISTRCATASCARPTWRRAHRPRSSGGPGRPGRPLRYGALPECARVPGRPRPRARFSARHPEAQWRAGGAGALRPAFVRDPRSKLGTQAPLQLAGSAPVARIPWLRGGNRLQFQQGRCAAMVGV